MTAITASPTSAVTSTHAPPTWRVLASVAGPALLAVIGFLSPIDDTDEPGDRLADAFANATRHDLALVCLVSAMMLLVPAVIAIRDRVPRTQARSASVGAAIAAAGFMCFVVVSGALGFALSVVRDATT